MKFTASTNLSVREGPNISAHRTGYLSEGQECEGFEVENGYRRIVYHDPYGEKSGWAADEYLVPESAQQVPVIPGIVEIAEEVRGTHIRAQQYIFWPSREDGAEKHNLCGEFAVAAMAGAPIETFLTVWLETSPDLATPIIQNDRPTGMSTVEDMMRSVGLQFDPDNKEITLATLSEIDGKSMLVGVVIDPNGYIIPHSDIGHWVVITGYQRVRNTAVLDIYNPFTNLIEHIWFDDFIASHRNLPYARLVYAKVEEPSCECSEPVSSAVIKASVKTIRSVIATLNAVASTLEGQVK